MYSYTQLLVKHVRANYKAYAVTTGAWLAVIVVKLFFQTLFDEVTYPFLLFSWVIVVGAWYGGKIGGWWATFLSVISLWYLFLLSPGSWRLDGAIEPVAVLFFIGEALLITKITSNLRESRKHLAVTLKNLRQSTEKFNLFSNNAKGFALIFLDPNGEVVDWNPGAQRLLGYRDTQVINQSFMSFYPPVSMAPDKVWSLKKEQIMAHGWMTEEQWLRLPNQRQIWCHITYVNLEDDLGRTRGIGVICRDRTDRKELDLQKDAFLDGASHELKTPLTTIKLLSQISLQKVSKRNPAYQNLQRIDLEVNRLVDLVNIMLDVTKIQKRTLKPQFGMLEVEKIIKTIQERFSPEQVKLVIEPTVTNQQIVADEKRLLSACSQLLHYLLADMASEKPIAVSVELEPDELTLIMKIVVKGIQRSAWLETRALLGEVKRQYYSNEKGDKGVGLYFATHIFILHDVRLMSRWSEEQGLTMKVVFPVVST